MYGVPCRVMSPVAVHWMTGTCVSRKSRERHTRTPFLYNPYTSHVVGEPQVHMHVILVKYVKVRICNRLIINIKQDRIFDIVFFQM